MSPSLTGEQRTLLEKLVQKARRTFEDDLATTLEGRYGIHTDDGHVEPTDAVSLPAAGLAIRVDLVDLLDYLRAEGASPAEAAQRLVREAAFTHLNRLIAVRVAEAIGLMPATLSRGLESAGFRDFSEIAPAAATSEWERYALFVRLCADELATDVPALFDPRNPLLELEPSTSALAEVVELIVGAPGELWEAPDTLGWAYQFFNTSAERKAMREKPAPSNSRELAVRNQFFTPDYVVEFLVHNGLGAHLAAGVPGLADDLHMLVEEPTETIDVDLAKVSVLDPACGSGHFLLGAYDVLERAWELTGVSRDEAAPAILQSLWGIDIDPRATQIAQAAVLFRARRHHRRGELPRPNVIAARALPTGPTTGELIAELPERVGRAVRAIADELVNAPILGPLLKIEERLDIEARDLFGTGEVAGTLAEAADDTESIEAAILDGLSRIAGGATSSAGHRLFAAEAFDAVRFVEAMSRRYTAVLMNPPFGEPVPETKPYLKAAYPRSEGTTDVLAYFVDRGTDLSNAEGGTVGAITSRTGLFLGSFETWRTQVVAPRLFALIDLGEKVMEQATVEAAAYTIRHKLPTSGKAPICVRVLRETDRASAVLRAASDSRQGHPSAYTFSPDIATLSDALPKAPLAYWIDSETARQVGSHQAFEPSRGFVRQGLATGDDFRFIRAWWEVSPNRVSAPSDLADGLDSREQLCSGARWAPIVKSGTSQPWFSPLTLLVDWQNDGERLRSFTAPDGRLKSRPQNTDLYFRPGFSWTRRAPRLVPYVVPAGCIPSVSRYQAFIELEDATAVLGVVASRTASAFLRLYGEKFLWPNFLVDDIKNLPIPEIDSDTLRMLNDFVSREVERRRSLYRAREPFLEFVRPDSDVDSTEWNAESLLTNELERRISQAFGLSVEGERTFCRDLDEVIDATGNTRVTSDDQSESDDPSAGSEASRWMSYAVGLAFGRWDIRIAQGLLEPSGPRGAFEVPVPWPPGMLCGADGKPTLSPPSDYEFSIPKSGILVDQPGHEWDIVARADAASDEATGSSGYLDSVFRQVDVSKSTRSFLRSRFFGEHLRTYSAQKGKRKAPIYWQLQVPSKQWGLWLYAPKLSREMLFGVVREAEQRLRLAEQQVAHLQREIDDGTSGRKTSAVAKELEAEQKLLGELTTFRAEAERIANLGWEPDLDDGMVLNAAPLADLFPAWKDAAKYREELRAGKHEWATVARYAGEL